MEQNGTQIPHYKRVKDICVDLYTQDENVEKRLLCGKALINSEKGELMFSQNPPRVNRSIEISRLAHGRLVRRHDGFYTLTFRYINGGEKNLAESLLAEVRRFATTIKTDCKDKKGGKEK